jgi:serine/threonine protein kinase
VNPDLLPQLQAALGGEYRLDKELGGGGMSRVYLAEELGLGRRVVVKVLLDVLSRSLDGAGPLRTVSPTLVVKRWSGRADAASARALARETGARTVVYGQLVGAGPDSVRLTASVLDARTGASLGAASSSPFPTRRWRQGGNTRAATRARASTPSRPAV